VKSRLIACALVVSSILLAAPSVARATTINFAGLSASGTPEPSWGGLRYFGSSLTYQGFTFTSSYNNGGFGLTIWETTSLNHPTGGSATTSLFEYVALETTTITRANATPFELNGIDLANWGANQTNFPSTFGVTFTGTKSNLSTVSQTFLVTNTGPNGASPQLQSFLFSGFTDLISVQMTQGIYSGGNAFQYNNLVVDASAPAPVPEPGTLLMVAGGLAILRRRLRSRA